MNSSKAKFLCITYDISNNRRRNCVFKALKRYGVPVQYSMFECWLSERQLKDLRNELARIVSEDDSIRFYDLCHACHRATITIGTAETTHLNHTYIY